MTSKIKLQHINISLIVIFLSLIILSSITVVSKGEGIKTQSIVDLGIVDVAVYNGMGTDEDLGSWTALVNMFKWMKADVDTIDALEIRSGALNNYDILCMPDGNMYDYGYHLGDDGIEIIRQFISNGGSYFGIGEGAHFATNYKLKLIDGTFQARPTGVARGIYILDMMINRNSTGPDLSEEPESYSLLYWDSKYYAAEDISNIIPIAFYPKTDEAGMIAFKYGKGTVFLSSPHPEYEENSDRDGVDKFDNYDDPDSEWDLLLKVSIWLVEASEVKENLLAFWTLIGAVIIISVLVGFFGFIAVIILLTKRRNRNIDLEQRTEDFHVPREL